MISSLSCPLSPRQPSTLHLLPYVNMESPQKHNMYARTWMQHMLARPASLGAVTLAPRQVSPHFSLRPSNTWEDLRDHTAQKWLLLMPNLSCGAAGLAWVRALAPYH